MAASMWGGHFVSWTDPKTVEALQFLADLITKDGVWGGWWDQRTAASYFMWGTHIATNQSITDFTWDVIAPPAGGKGQMTYSKGNEMTIPKGAQHKEEAWKLMQFLASEQGQYLFGSKGLAFPVHRRAALRVVNENRSKAPLHYMSLLEMNSRPLPICPEWAELDAMMKQEMGPLWDGLEPATTVTQRLSELTKAIFAKSK